MTNPRSKASNKYNAANVKQIKINLNKKYDADIIAVMESVQNKQGFLKELIRDWIADHQH